MNILYRVIAVDTYVFAELKSNHTRPTKREDRRLVGY